MLLIYCFKSIYLDIHNVLSIIFSHCYFDIQYIIFRIF